METSLFYDLKDKQLCFKLRERVTADPELELKGKGRFNTVDGTLSYRAHLKKFVSSGTVVKGIATTPLRVGAGVAVISTRSATTSSKAALKPDMLLNVSVDKKLALLDGPNTVLCLKAALDLDPQSKKIMSDGELTAQRLPLGSIRYRIKGTPEASRTGSVRLVRKFPGITNHQDLRITAGMDLEWPTTTRKTKPELMFQVKENNWALNFRQKRWNVTYDL